jgi:hypothetical protein
VARKKLSTTVYLTVEQDQALKALSEKTKVPARARREVSSNRLDAGEPEQRHAVNLARTE